MSVELDTFTLEDLTDHACILLFGRRGCGKSVLASYFVDYLAPFCERIYVFSMFVGAYDVSDMDRFDISPKSALTESPGVNSFDISPESTSEVFYMDIIKTLFANRAVEIEQATENGSLDSVKPICIVLDDVLPAYYADLLQKDPATLRIILICTVQYIYIFIPAILPMFTLFFIFSENQERLQDRLYDRIFSKEMSREDFKVLLKATTQDIGSTLVCARTRTEETSHIYRYKCPLLTRSSESNHCAQQ